MLVPTLLIQGMQDCSVIPKVLSKAFCVYAPITACLKRGSHIDCENPNLGLILQPLGCKKHPRTNTAICCAAHLGTLKCG